MEVGGILSKKEMCAFSDRSNIEFKFPCNYGNGLDEQSCKMRRQYRAEILRRKRLKATKGSHFGGNTFPTTLDFCNLSKEEIRRKRNRESAERSRQRKLGRIDHLTVKACEQHVQYADLIEENARLRILQDSRKRSPFCSSYVCDPYCPTSSRPTSFDELPNFSSSLVSSLSIASPHADDVSFYDGDDSSCSSDNQSCFNDSFLVDDGSTDCTTDSDTSSISTENDKWVSKNSFPMYATTSNDDFSDDFNIFLASLAIPDQIPSFCI